MQLSQVCAIVSALAPIDTNGAAKNHCIVGLKEYNHATLIVQIGNITGDVTLTVEKCDDTTPTTATAIAFNYRKASTGAAAKSVLDAALSAATTAGITIANATDDNKVIAIELDASEIGPSYPYVRVATSNPGAATLISGIAILSEPRWAKDVMPDPTN